MGREEYVEVSVIKDAVDPDITIISPLQNEEYGYDSPFYTFSIVEPNFESAWYKINNSTTNYSIYILEYFSSLRND